MIDTIVIVLNQLDFRLVDPDKFYPSARGIFSPTMGNFVAHQNPTKNELWEGNYKPKLTLYKRTEMGHYSIDLYIQFSAPKLLFGNNFFEVKESDFELLINTLITKLRSMGIETTFESIANASVSRIDYGKNFVLTDYTTPFTYISEIMKADISRVYDTNKADYRNEGHSYKFQTNSFELIFYDKLMDLSKASVSQKKSVESSLTTVNEFTKSLRERRVANPPFEVLRMELRLNKRRKIKDELKKIGITAEPTFRELFSKTIARTLCINILIQVKKRLLFGEDATGKPFTTQFASLIRTNPQMRPQFLLQYLAFKTIVDETDVRTARKLFDPTSSGKWYSFKKAMESIKEPQALYEIDKLIHTLEVFQAIRELDFS